MSKDIRQTALQVRQAITPSEASADETLGRIGLLLHTTCVASARLGVAPQASRAMMKAVAMAVSHQLEVREALLSAHDEAAVIYRELFPEVAAGDHGCPPQKFFTEGADQLQPVTASA